MGFDAGYEKRRLESRISGIADRAEEHFQWVRSTKEAAYRF